MPAWFVSTSLVTKRAGIAARSATDHPLASKNVDDNFWHLSHTDNKCPYFVWWHTPFCIWSLNSSHCISFLAALLPTQLLLLLVEVMMLDLLNAEVLEGQRGRGKGNYTNATQSLPQWFCINNDVSHLPLIVRGKVTKHCEGQSHKATFYWLTPATSSFSLSSCIDNLHCLSEY